MFADTGLSVPSVMVIYSPSMSKAPASIADGMAHARLMNPAGHTDAIVKQ